MQLWLVSEQGYRREGERDRGPTTAVTPTSRLPKTGSEDMHAGGGVPGKYNLLNLIKKFGSMFILMPCALKTQATNIGALVLALD